MRLRIALISGLVFGPPPLAATAATFTPDMWVYEVTFTAKTVSLGNEVANTTASPDTPVPLGCDYYELDNGNIGISCDGLPAGLDPIATLDQPYRDNYLTRVQKIGFNETKIVCDGGMAGCPENAEKPTRGELSGLGSRFFEDIAQDFSTGALSFCATVSEISYACYSLSPDSVTGTGGLNAVYVKGTWDYGFGGFWDANLDPFFEYTATGRLLSAPSVVPLPAPLLMLGSALAALGVARAAGRRRAAGA